MLHIKLIHAFFHWDIVFTFLTFVDLTWPLTATEIMGFFLSLWYIQIPSMKSIHRSHLDILCLQANHQNHKHAHHFTPYPPQSHIHTTSWLRWFLMSSVSNQKRPARRVTKYSSHNFSKMIAKAFMRFPRSQNKPPFLQSRLKLISTKQFSFVFVFLIWPSIHLKLYLYNKIESGLAEDMRYLHVQTLMQGRPICYQGWYFLITSQPIRTWKVFTNK